MSSALLSLRQFFDQHEFQAPDLPVVCSVVIPNANALARWRDFPEAALPVRGRVANGTGLSSRDCENSGLGEAVELASACSWKDEQTIQVPIDDAAIVTVHPEEFLGFSPEQLEARRSWNESECGFDWRPNPKRHSRPIPCVKARNAYDNSSVFVTADFVYIGRCEAGDEAAVAVADSSGCASGPDQAFAHLGAVLELIERDATGRWWYGMRKRPVIPLDILYDHGNLADALKRRERETRLFDITTDIGVPCVAAVSAERDGTALALGFSAKLDMRSAALSAVLELAQTEFSVRAMCDQGQPSTVWQRWLSLAHFSHPMFQVTKQTNIPLADKQLSNAQALEEVLERLKKTGCRIYFKDLTRPEFDVATVRAMSPDLCHYKPRFGFKRLLAADDKDLSQASPAAAAPNPILLTI